MCIPWTRDKYAVVITRQSNPPISQFKSPCNEFTSVWSAMFVYNTYLPVTVETILSCGVYIPYSRLFTSIKTITNKSALTCVC